MSSNTPSNTAANLRLEKMVPGIGTIRRWRILVELGKGEPLPAKEIARRVRISRGTASRILIQLREIGMLERGYGHLYRIPQHFFVPGENAIDFGAFVLRLDYPDPERKAKARRGNDSTESAGG